MPNEQRSRVITASVDIPADYHADRLRWWTINSQTWSKHIDADQGRFVLLQNLAVKAIELARTIECRTMLDIGCGEGAFLRHLKLLDPDMTLHGIDFCDEMLAEAKRRSTGTGLRYSLSDLETMDFQAPCNANMVTSILAIDEMDQLEIVFRNIAKTLLLGGIAMLVVMDPLLELERNRAALEGAFVSKGQADEAILLVKTFPQSGPEQTAPYCRIVRPIAAYNASAATAGLTPFPVNQLSHAVGIGLYADSLLFDVLIFRKDRGART